MTIFAHMDVITFLKKHPEIKRVHLEKKCGIPQSTLYHVTSGRRSLSRKYIPILKRNLAKYGYEEKNNLEKEAA